MFFIQLVHQVKIAAARHVKADKKLSRMVHKDGQLLDFLVAIKFYLCHLAFCPTPAVAQSDSFAVHLNFLPEVKPAIYSL